MLPHPLSLGERGGQGFLFYSLGFTRQKSLRLIPAAWDPACHARDRTATVSVMKGSRTAGRDRQLHLARLASGLTPSRYFFRFFLRTTLLLCHPPSPSFSDAARLAEPLNHTGKGVESRKQ